MEPGWRIVERDHAGDEHLDPDAVASYDRKARFDPSVELDLLLELGLSPQDTVVDFGAATGTFCLAVADHCRRAIAVDVSEAMLAILREKRADRGIENVEVVHSGVVGYEHQGEPASVVFSRNTLHHLTDFWKVEAFKTVADTLEPGGIFRFRDLAYAFDPWQSAEAIESWIDGMSETDFTSDELHAHVRDEFSTYGFVLESLLEHTGFEILEASYADGFYAAYTCRWSGRRAR